MILDLLNCFFEAGGGLAACLNVRRLWIDRDIKGIDWKAVAFFALWGFFNLILYPSVHLPFSAAAAVGLCLVNATWLASSAAIAVVKRNNLLSSVATAPVQTVVVVAAKFVIAAALKHMRKVLADVRAIVVISLRALTG